MHNNLMNSMNLIIYKKCIEKFNKTKYMTNKMKMYMQIFHMLEI